MADWSGKRVVVIGLARQGKALTRYLASRGAQVIVSDVKPRAALSAAIEELADLSPQYVLGGHPPELIAGADLLCLSGGVPADLPLAQQARARGVPLSNDSQIFMEACPAPTIGITGSAGKTTTTALVGRMAELALEPRGRRAWVGGNIGRPLLEDLDAIGPEDAVVLELSSFQLELMTASPRVAAVLNLTPNHLDRHKTMAAYAGAKARILEFQRPEDVAVLGSDDPGAWSLRDRVRGRLHTFGTQAPAGEGAYLQGGEIRLRTSKGEAVVCATEDVRLRGPHNLLNVAAACALAAAAGFEPQAMRQAIQGFRGVPHRLEYVRRVRGADWYNDSIATTPERAMAAIRSFEEPLVLLAGGRDKDLPWEDFANLVSRRVDHLILFGEAAEKIRRAVAGAAGGGRPFSLDVCPDLEAAVQTAARRAEAGDVVVLAPGGTSFDAFVDFAERGERFRQLVQAL